MADDFTLPGLNVQQEVGYEDTKTELCTLSFVSIR